MELLDEFKRPVFRICLVADSLDVSGSKPAVKKRLPGSRRP